MGRCLLPRARHQSVAAQCRAAPISAPISGDIFNRDFVRFLQRTVCGYARNVEGHRSGDRTAISFAFNTANIFLMNAHSGATEENNADSVVGKPARIDSVPARVTPDFAEHVAALLDAERVENERKRRRQQLAYVWVPFGVAAAVGLPALLWMWSRIR